MTNIGFLQGRLSPPVGTHIQEFPEDWHAELSVAKANGFSHMEWIVTKDSFATNPVFSEDVSSYSISSICADNLVDERISEHEYLYNNLIPVCLAAILNDIELVTIPLLEESAMEDPATRKTFADLMTAIAQMYPQLKFCFECELGIDETKEILERHPNFFLTYDTGNITSYGLSHEEYIEKLGHRIMNVHLKDRTLGGVTMPPSHGDTDFKLIFKLLRKIGYNGVYTMQTAREQAGEELHTLLKHKKVFEELYE